MSTNCLKTQLKGTVSKDLPVYNEISFDVPANTAFTNINVKCIPNGIISMTGDVEGYNYSGTTKVADSNTPYNVGATPYRGQVIRIKSGSNGGRLIIHGIYNMVPSESAGWFSFIPTYFNNINGYKMWFKGDIVSIVSKLEGTTKDIASVAQYATSLTINSATKITGSISALSTLKDTLTALSINASGITGGMTDLGVFTECNAISDYRNLRNSPVDIEDLVRSFIANHSQKTSISAAFGLGHHFNGVEVDNTTATLSWTNTTATFKGVEVNL